MLLYHMRDLHTAFLAPLRFAAEATEVAFRNPFLPTSYTDMARILAAGAELLERSTRPFEKPSFGLNTTSCLGHTVPVTEEIVLQKPFCSLLHFKREPEEPEARARMANDPKLLIVAPLSGHFATLLRGTVEAFLPDHDVFITDWIDAKNVPLNQGSFDLEDNITTVMEALRHLGPSTHVLGVCQATVPVLAATALMNEQEDPASPRSMILIGGPIDVRRAKSGLSEAAAQHPLAWFEDRYIQNIPPYYPGAYRPVFPGFLQLQAYLSTNAERHIDEQIKLFQNLVRGNEEAVEANHAFYNEFLSTMDVTAEFYLQTIERVFQKGDLPRGAFTWHGKKVRPDEIRKTALLTIEGDLDDIAPAGQTLAAHELCSALPSSMKRAHLEIGVGHYGLFSGRRWRNTIQPLIAGFIRDNNRLDDEELPLYLAKEKAP